MTTEEQRAADGLHYEYGGPGQLVLVQFTYEGAPGAVTQMRLARRHVTFLVALVTVMAINGTVAIFGYCAGWYWPPVAWFIIGGSVTAIALQFRTVRRWLTPWQHWAQPSTMVAPSPPRTMS